MNPSPLDSFGIAFSTLARRWRMQLDRALAASGLTDATWTPLIHLATSGEGAPQKVLAERIGIDSSTLVRLLDILEGRGLIERRTAVDRRARLIYLTPQGRQAVGAIRAALGEAEKEMLAHVDEHELELVMTILDKIGRRLDEMDAR